MTLRRSRTTATTRTATPCRRPSSGESHQSRCEAPAPSLPAAGESTTPGTVAAAAMTGKCEARAEVERAAGGLASYAQGSRGTVRGSVTDDGRQDPGAACMTRPETCAKCGQEPPGPGGILCPGCKLRIEAQQPAPPRGRVTACREL